MACKAIGQFLLVLLLTPNVLADASGASGAFVVPWAQFSGHSAQPHPPNAPSDLLLPLESRSAVMTELRAFIRKQPSQHKVLATDDELVIKGTFEVEPGKGVTDTTVSFDPKLLKLLPPTDYMPYGQRKFRSCAVVGNSGALLGSNYGAEIDSHDAVMRINYPPTEGYEADVGSNTTFDMINCKNTQRVTREYRHVRDSIYLFHPSLTEVHTKFRKCFMGFFDKFADGQGLIVNPSSRDDANAVFDMVKEAIETQNKTTLFSKPNSGFNAVIFLTQVCEQVDAYGFRPYITLQGVPNHYFRGHADQEQPKFYMDAVKEGGAGGHSYSLAFDFLRLLGEVYPLELK